MDYKFLYFRQHDHDCSVSFVIYRNDQPHSGGYVQRWSGYVFGVTFLMAFVISPFWGRFGDKRGYKKFS
ncbi:hypothetical protein QNN00_09130 [Bacillus velezensis]|nr:hypothetical protein [Bacillus velezensis]